MEAGVGQVVAVTGGGDGAHIADVLDHGGERQGHDGDGGGNEHGGVQVVPGKEAEDRVAPLEGKTQPSGFLHGGEVHIAGDGGHQVRGHHAQEDGDDLNHALAEDVGHHDHQDGNQGDPPVALAVVDGRGAQGEADADDDGAGDNGREEAHDLLDAEDLEERRQDHVEKTRQRHAEAGVRQKLQVGDGGLSGGVGEHGGNGRVAADEGEGRA